MARQRTTRGMEARRWSAIGVAALCALALTGCFGPRQAQSVEMTLDCYETTSAGQLGAPLGPETFVLTVAMPTWANPGSELDVTGATVSSNPLAEEAQVLVFTTPDGIDVGDPDGIPNALGGNAVAHGSAELRGTARVTYESDTIASSAVNTIVFLRTDGTGVGCVAPDAAHPPTWFTIETRGPVVEDAAAL